MERRFLTADQGGVGGTAVPPLRLPAADSHGKKKNGGLTVPSCQTFSGTSNGFRYSRRNSRFASSSPRMVALLLWDQHRESKSVTLRFTSDIFPRYIDFGANEDPECQAQGNQAIDGR